MRKALIGIVVLVVITLAGVTCYYYYKTAEHKSIAQADREQSGGLYVALSQGVTHYQIAGPDTGKVVILIHGFSVPYYIWDGTFEYLAANGFRVVRYDEFGRGFSDRPDVVYNKELYMTQLHELIDKLKLKTPVNLAGVSFGAKVASNFAVANPSLVDKVVLVDPAYQGGKPSVPQFVAAYYEKVNPEKRAAGQLEDFKQPEKHPGWVEKYSVQQQYYGFVNALISTVYNYPANGRKEFTELNALHKPVLLIWGKYDQTVLFQFSDSVRSVLECQFLPMSESGHLPHLEEPDVVNAEIAKFLK